MRSLQGKDEHFMSERQRQAELARLKREKLKAKQEDKFITAALVLGLAEKQKAAVEERLGTSHFLSRGGGRGGEGWWRMLGTETNLQFCVKPTLPLKHNKIAKVYIYR